MHDLAPVDIDVLVALTAATHGQSGIHVHVVAGEVETDQELEDHAPARLGCRQENEQAGCCAAVCHHVQHSAELGGLIELARSVAVQGIQQT